MKKSNLFNAPIPGENLTVDNRGYPLHKPPLYTDFDDAFEYFVDNILGNHEAIGAAASIASNGISAVSLTQTAMLQAVATGKITPDMTLLIAGPYYATLTKMLDALGVAYLNGFETREELMEFAKAFKAGKKPEGKAAKPMKLTKSQEEEMDKITQEALEEPPVGGLMGRPSDEEKIDIPASGTGSGLVPEEITEEGEK